VACKLLWTKTPGIKETGRIALRALGRGGAGAERLGNEKGGKRSRNVITSKKK